MYQMLNGLKTDWKKLMEEKWLLNIVDTSAEPQIIEYTEYIWYTDWLHRRSKTGCLLCSCIFCQAFTSSHW